ncbi:MAG TPA: hypothetical protein VMG60_24800 [Burkholderiaceae bacterium]|nr:hypothetical protein [Burkholderiaceae bacterium]
MAAVSGTNPVPGWQRIMLDAALIALVVSGLLWLLAHYAFGAGREEIGLPHWSEAWLMRAHGLAGFVVLVAVGTFLSVHVPRGWRMRENRSFEITMLACLGIAVATAYALYYFAPDPVRPALGWLHSAVGCAWGTTVVCHRRRKTTRTTVSLQAAGEAARPSQTGATRLALGANNAQESDRK